MEKLVAIVGPTATGKSAVSINLAQMLATEIISADSMCVYRGLDVGTAKPSLSERQMVRHHLIDILEPTAEYSVAQFVRLARALITELNKRGMVPILAGGTGLYVKALLENYHFEPCGQDLALRRYLEEKAEKIGTTGLFAELEKILPTAAQRIHPNDRRRIIRALEIYYSTGNPVLYPKRDAGLAYDCAVIGLTMERELLYNRINQRVDAMLRNGLVEEVATLLSRGIPPDCQAFQGIGYKEVVPYAMGKVSDLASISEQIKKNTRNFAKRQFTWFRSMPYITWMMLDGREPPGQVAAMIYDRLKTTHLLRTDL